MPNTLTDAMRDTINNKLALKRPITQTEAKALVNHIATLEFALHHQPGVKMPVVAPV